MKPSPSRKPRLDVSSPTRLTLNKLYPEYGQRHRLRIVAYALLTDNPDPFAAVASLTNAGVNEDGARLLIAEVSKTMKRDLLTFVGKNVSMALTAELHGFSEAST